VPEAVPLSIVVEKHGNRWIRGYKKAEINPR
jgi:hypothetical protein